MGSDQSKSKPKAKDIVMVSVRMCREMNAFLKRTTGATWEHGSLRKNLMSVVVDDGFDTVMNVDPVAAIGVDMGDQVITTVNFPTSVIERLKSIASGKLAGGKPISVNQLLNQACKDAAARVRAKAQAADAASLGV